MCLGVPSPHFVRPPHAFIVPCIDRHIRIRLVSHSNANEYEYEWVVKYSFNPKKKTLFFNFLG